MGTYLSTWEQNFPGRGGANLSYLWPKTDLATAILASVFGFFLLLFSLIFGAKSEGGKSDKINHLILKITFLLTSEQKIVKEQKLHQCASINNFSFEPHANAMRSYSYCHSMGEKSKICLYLFPRLP